jgi:uncharacterized protein (DUF433 family)
MIFVSTFTQPNRLLRLSICGGKNVITNHLNRVYNIASTCGKQNTQTEEKAEITPEAINFVG